MSALTRFMHTAREILDDQDRIATPHEQPPFFVRMHWVFEELELLALPGEASLFERIKIARLQCDPTTAMEQIELLKKNTEELPHSAVWHQRAEMCRWIEEYFEREMKS